MKKSSRFHFTPTKRRSFQIEEVDLRVEAESVPLNSYKPNFVSGLFARELRDFYDNTNIKTHPTGNAITPELYKEGACLFAWDFSPDR